jgi:hypothetical protein
MGFVEYNAGRGRGSDEGQAEREDYPTDQRKQEKEFAFVEPIGQ